MRYQETNQLVICKVKSKIFFALFSLIFLSYNAHAQVCTLTGINRTITDATCSEASDGQISITPVGGSPATTTISWTTLLPSPNVQSTATAINLPPGDYSVTVFDPLGGPACSFDRTYTVEAAFTDIEIDAYAKSEESCPGASDGWVSINVTGGSGSYDYDWSTGATSQDVSELSPGSYSVTISDQLNSECNVNGSYTIGTVGTLSTQFNDVMESGADGCPGTTVTLEATGGINGTGAVIRWYTGPNGTGSQVDTGASIEVSPLTTTTYYVRREGDCNTTADNSIEVTAEDVVAPSALCRDITIQLDGTTGNASHTAADIDDGSLDNCSSVSLAATPTAYTCSDVGGNTSELTVTDDEGNSSSCTATVTVLLLNSFTIDTAICFGQSVSGYTTTGTYIDTFATTGCDSIRTLNLTVYNSSAVTSLITQIGLDINGEAASDFSGNSVSFSSDGSRVAIGAYGNDGNGSDAGHVRIYEFTNCGWVQLGLDIDGEVAGDWSGWSVSLSSDGSRVAIGAYNNDGNAPWAGHVRIYDWNGSAWVQVG